MESSEMNVIEKDNDGDLQTVTKPKQARVTRTEVLFQCNRCLMTFESFVKLRTHYESTHDTEGGKSPIVRGSKEHYTRLYHCIPCNKDFDEDLIIRHQNKHKEEINKVCDICGRVFTVRGTWHKHLRQHRAFSTGKRLQCKLCGKTFTLISDLKKHMPYHSKERPHICEVCGKGFKDRNSVKKHRKIHLTVKPHTCQFCGKGFAQLYNLRGHLRTHTGEKPFKCDLCSSVFAHKGTLTCHKKTVHGVDTSEYQKLHSVQEFDDINVSDPQMYENCTIRITPTEGSNAIRSSDETFEKPGEGEPSKLPVTHHDKSQTLSADTKFEPHQILLAPATLATNVTQDYHLSSQSIRSIDGTSDLQSSYSQDTGCNGAKGTPGMSYTPL